MRAGSSTVRVGTVDDGELLPRSIHAGRFEATEADIPGGCKGGKTI